MLVPFHKLTDRQLADVVAIYEESLAAPWEWPVERFYELARAPEGAMWHAAALDGNEAAGFIINEYLPGGRLWYCHYFAVRADIRGQGWGGRILTAALPHGEEAAHRHGHDGCLGALIEAEVLDSPPADADREQRARRQAFYRRNGALLTGTRYPRPPWAPPAMPDWDLLFVPGAAWDGRIDDAFRYRILRSLMVEAYHTPKDAQWFIDVLRQYAPSSGA